MKRTIKILTIVTVFLAIPQEATNWTAQAGVKPEDCFAFQLERHGQVAEVVLVRDSGSEGLSVYRIVRVHNVKQMVVPNTVTAS